MKTSDAVYAMFLVDMENKKPIIVAVYAKE